jgi:hypothetical protein
MAWAMVTLAGTPVDLNERWAATPTVLMNSVPEANAYDSRVLDTLGLAAVGTGSGTGGVIGPTSPRCTHAMPG